MDNQEIFNRIDVLYNNIMSDKAPGLDEYEASVFFNKAQLEVLKNHLNPKGNRYTEGFDFSSKRQVEFASIIKSFIFEFPLDTVPGGYSGISYMTDKWMQNPLSIINERIDVITKQEHETLSYYIGSFIDLVFEESGGLDALTGFISWILSNNIQNQDLLDKLKGVIEALLTGSSAVIDATFTRTPTIQQALKDLEITTKSKVIVPINSVEADTLFSRPYKYPPKSQAWRMLVNELPEFIIGPDEVPITYVSRYVKTPQEVNLTYKDTTDENYSKHCCELPDFLIDEVLQRTVELAKNAWEGTLETTQTFGERSE